jgi:methylase of polypeptide subunit release factors
LHRTDADLALLELLAALRRRGYRFVTPTNSTYRIVLRRPDKRIGRDLRDVLGWSLPFCPGSIDEEVETLLARAGCLAAVDSGVKATVRVSEVQSQLFLHSDYPPDADAVFLGPDTYRFAEFLRSELSAASRPIVRILDVGAGAGVGGIIAARLTGASDVVLSDVNARGLHLASLNAAHAGTPVRTALGDSLEGLEGPFDLVIANPPFIAEDGRTYADGGHDGTALSLRWASEALTRLSPHGRLLMYTGAPIVQGEDALREALARAASAHSMRFAYREIDPDIFGGELRRAAYAKVERIAAVGIVIGPAREIGAA